jgi:hypothetical protein
MDGMARKEKRRCEGGRAKGLHKAKESHKRCVAKKKEQQDYEN